MHRFGTPAQIQRTFVGAVGTPGGQRDVHGAVEFFGRHRHLGQMLGLLGSDGAAGVQ